jgi:hypothetical protein
VVTFEASARIAAGQPPVHEVGAYLTKYRAGIASLGMTPERMAADYSVALRLTPTRVRTY